MSTNSKTVRRYLRSVSTRYSFRGLLTVTLGLVAATILLGVAAKATGAGLACEANWPQCDAGPFNLLPANIPSFYEWIHRFVAMFAGIGIVASGAAAWLSSSVDRRVFWLVVSGTVLTPIQVYLGRETVLQYQMDILSLHFWTAILIFGMFTVATVLVWEPRLHGGQVTWALGVGLLSLPLHVALSPTDLGVISEYTPTVQLLQYAVTLALLGSVIFAVMVGRWRYESRRLYAALYSSGILALVAAYLGRQGVMTFSPSLINAYFVSVAVLAVVFVVGIALAVSLKDAG